MDSMIELLKTWQTLIGGVLGGVFALGAALVVSHRLERRQDLSAAMLAIGTLVWVTGTKRQVDTWIEEENIDSEKDPLRAVERLVFSYPKLSAGFENAAMRLYPVHEKIAVHLDVFRTIYVDLEEQLRALKRKADVDEGQQDSLFPSLGLEPQARSILVSLESAAEQAEPAIKLLEYLVLSKTPTINRLRLQIWPPHRLREIMQKSPHEKF